MDSREELKLIPLPKPQFHGVDIEDQKWKYSNSLSLDHNLLSQKLDEFGGDYQLYDFQKACIYFIILNQGRLLICDEMGLGKTIEIIGYYWYHPVKTVVICPANYKFGWAKEFVKWMGPLQIGVFQPKITKSSQKYYEELGIQILNKFSDLSTLDILIVNYEYIKGQDGQRKGILGNSLVQRILGNFKPVRIVIDEADRISNYRAQTTKGCLKIAWNCKDVIGLTGTPIRNRTADFYTILKLISPNQFKDWKKFVMRYCNGNYVQRYTKGGVVKEYLDYSGSSNWGELAIKIKPFMIRRERTDVLPQLPPKIRQIVPLEIEGYNKFEKHIFDSNESTLSIISTLRLHVASHKIPAAQELMRKVLEDSQSLVVYYHHKMIGLQLGYILEEMKVSFDKIDGSVPSWKRQKLVDNFQEGKINCMLLSTKAAGTGIRLDRCCKGIFVEPQWSPSTILQAEDRLSSVNQKNQVHIYHLHAVGTVEDLFYLSLDDKMKAIKRIINMDYSEGGLIEAATKYISDRKRERKDNSKVGS